jgi:putative ATPase
MSTKNHQQSSFFEDHEKSEAQEQGSVADSQSPLGHRARPERFEDFHGQEHLFERFKFLKTADFPSLVLWGPPGSGKTTLAALLAKQSGKDLYRFNAVLGGVADLKKLIASALEMKKTLKRQSIIFVDEIHRFNKAQQDALLPYVEAGDFTFIGATTENPRSSVNRALISRVKVIELKKLTPKAVTAILSDACNKFNFEIKSEILEVIADYADGDARAALSTLELAQANQISSTHEVKKLILENVRDYDRNQNRHYDVISAFIKSMRGSDPQAALLWLAVMIDGGEDPVFIARRLVIFASEDVGNADPTGLQLAVNALHTVEKIGMPEARIPLAQATTYLASTVKSNAAYNGINAALEFVQNHSTIEVPTYLRNHHPDGKKYQYPHSHSNAFVDQDYSGLELPNFYSPTEFGLEKRLKERLRALWGHRL